MTGVATAQAPMYVIVNIRIRSLSFQIAAGRAGWCGDARPSDKIP
jgi:hypothetical protein